MECSVCLQEYVVPAREPQVLSCGHTFCKECVAIISAASGVRCPVCRLSTPAGEVRVNFALRDALSSGAAAAGAAPQAQAAPATPAAPEPMDEDLVVNLRVLAQPVAGGMEDGNTEADVLVSVVPPSGSSRSPCDVCCVVDVSDSMGAEAMAKDGAGATTSHGLEILDVVRHALRTIIHTLGSNDRLAVVAYASGARAVLQPTAMDEQGRRTAAARLALLQLDGMTNLWSGLQLGVDLLAAARQPGRLQHILLLTDGVPNINPPRGIVPMLQKVKQKMGGTLPCSVSTFGFGNDLDSELLVELARIGSGSYAFIPDAGFVGTVFVNAMSNLLVTMASNVSLRLRPAGGASISASGARGCAPPKAVGDGIEVDLVSLQFGQSRDVFLRMRLPPDCATGADFLQAEVQYTTRDQALPKTVAATGKLAVALSAEESEELEVQRCRATFVDSVRQVMKKAKLTNLDKLQGKALPLPDAQALVTEAAAAIRASPAADSPPVEGILEDLEGQVAEALSREEWYTKWGVHYLPSLVGAHLLQQCNNFKDPGVQAYGGELFGDIRDEADEVFCGLPPPVRTVRPSPQQAAAAPAAAPAAASRAAAPAAPPPPAPAPVAYSMSAYYDRYAGCLDGESQVLLADGAQRRAADVRRGDRLAAPGGGLSEVACVVRTLVPEGRMPLVRLSTALALTPHHPVLVDGAWRFPAELTEAALQPCSELITFLLREGDAGAVLAGGVPCVTLGHGLREGAAEHEYFGSGRVREDRQVAAAGRVGSHAPAASGPGSFGRLDESPRLRHQFAPR